jgi:hypothetical protein
MAVDPRLTNGTDTGVTAVGSTLNGGAYRRLEPSDLVVSNDSVTTAIWSDNSPTLTAFYTSSTQVASSTSEFYFDVYQTASGDDTAAVQFNVAYADAEGSGSAFYNALVTGSSPTGTNYGQYRNLVLGDENSSFIFGNQTSSYFYVINVERSRYKEHLLPGSLTLNLEGPGGATLQLTDDSQINTATVFVDAGRRYNLISGSAGTISGGALNTNGWSANSGSYGWFLPDVGLILLSGEALDGAGGAVGGIALNTTRSFDTATKNQSKIVDALNAGSGFTLNSQETLSSDYIFVRARNNEFNYSENPSFISGSTGVVLFDDFIDNPKTYITTVGLYNDNSELVAVAKLSRPLAKDYTKELLVRVKLDF